MHIADSLRMFARRGHVRMTVGVSMGGTSVEGLESLLECLDGRGEVWVFHNDNGPTFHPKVYFFSNDRNAKVIIGSGNLTQGGLFNNYEASIALALDLADPDDRALCAGVESVLDGYADRDSGTAVALSRETLESYASPATSFRKLRCVARNNDRRRRLPNLERRQRQANYFDMWRCLLRLPFRWSTATRSSDPLRRLPPRST